MIVDPPEAMRRAVLHYFGDRGAMWLATLPERIAEIAARWRVRPLRLAGDLSINMVLLCVDARDRHVVLKLGPSPDEIAREEQEAMRERASSIAAEVSRGLISLTKRSGELSATMRSTQARALEARAQELEDRIRRTRDVSLRRELASRVALRHIPFLQFQLDDSIREGTRILSLMDGLQPPEESG